jgi:hypothetical protein
MRLQTQATQAFTFFGSYLLERQLIALLKIAERGWKTWPASLEAQAALPVHVGEVE